MKPSSSPSDWTPDSPEFTAFALKDGPFDPAVPGWAERRAEAEQAVGGSSALRAEIGEVRRLADDIEVDLAREPIHRLSTERRQSVLAYARNPGRGLPRRSADDVPTSGGSGWHRLWSGLTRPAMGFSLAAATALSIALALWAPWRRPAVDVSAPAPVAKVATSDAPARPSRPAPAVGAEAQKPSSEIVVIEDTVREGGAEPTATPVRPEPAASVPRQEIERGESQLRWESAGGKPAVAAKILPSTSARSAPVLASKASAKSSPVPVQASRPVPAGSALARPASSADPMPSAAPAPAPHRRAPLTREIPFQSAAAEPRSSFPLKPADTSYPEVRRELEQGRLPSPDAVRLDELLNHFSYDYPAPSGADPLSAHVEVADSPWSSDHRLVKIGLQARSVPPAARPPASLAVLVGLRPGSQARLSWAQRSLQALVETLDGRDSLSLLIDGPQGRVILPPTSGADHDRLSHGVAALRAEGAPRGLDGLRRAYALAGQSGTNGGVHRVIWILDGEFSAEPGTRQALERLIGDQTGRGVVLTVLGLGASSAVGDASRDSWMPTPAGGAYTPAGDPIEAREALRRELNPAPTVAEGVKVDVRFNRARVDRWRLIGQETPASSVPSGKAADAPGVRVESGESVTALYEIVPTRPSETGATIPGSGPSTGGGVPDDLLRVQVGYRAPTNGNGSAGPSPGPQARSFEVGVPDGGRGIDAATADYKFAAAVVGYGLLLRDSPFKGDLTWDKVLVLAEEGQGPDREGYRAEFLRLVRRARDLHKASVEMPSAVRPNPTRPGAVSPRP